MHFCCLGMWIQKAFCPCPQNYSSTSKPVCSAVTGCGLSEHTHGQARLDLMGKCKPHTIAQSQEMLKTNIKASLSTRVSTFIDPNGKKTKRYAEVCSINQEDPKMRSGQKWNRSRQDDSSQNQGWKIRKSELRFQDQDWREIKNEPIQWVFLSGSFALDQFHFCWLSVRFEHRHDPADYKFLGARKTLVSKNLT